MAIQDNIAAASGTNHPDVVEQGIVLTRRLDLVLEVKRLTPFRLHLLSFPVNGMAYHFVELLHCASG